MKKQFIWIMTDTTRFDMLGCYGNKAMKTPHLDALAANGLRFERVYTAQPVCGPARSALFTGQFPHSNGSWANGMPLGAGVKTLGHQLSAEEIPCAYIGKWHLDGGDYFGKGICPEEWDADYWYDMKCYLDELTEQERVDSRNLGLVHRGGIDAGFTYGHRCADRAVKYIENHANSDFFLTLSFDEPHDPSLCPEPYASMYNDYEWEKTPAFYDTLENKPLYQQLWGEGGRAKDRQTLKVKNPLLFGCNSFIDAEVGRVLRKINHSVPDALILFTSDHGDALESHCLWAKGPSIYDDIARVPLIFSGKPCISGKVFPNTTSLIDLPATVMDFFGLRIPICFAGKSLMPVIQNGWDPDHKDEAFVEFSRYETDHDGFGGFQPMRAIVTDSYKLALHLLDEDELYDIKKDPYELNNLINTPEYQKVRNDLHDRILDFMNRTRDPFRGYQWQCRPWRTEKVTSWKVDGYTRQLENEPGEERQLDYTTGLPMKDAVREK